MHTPLWASPPALLIAPSSNHPACPSSDYGPGSPPGAGWSSSPGGAASSFPPSVLRARAMRGWVAILCSQAVRSKRKTVAPSTPPGNGPAWYLAEGKSVCFLGFARPLVLCRGWANARAGHAADTACGACRKPTGSWAGGSRASSKPTATVFGTTACVVARRGERGNSGSNAVTRASCPEVGACALVAEAGQAIDRNS